MGVFWRGGTSIRKDLFGVLGEFRSEFQSFCAFSSVGRATDF